MLFIHASYICSRFPVASTILAQNEVPFSLLETVSKTPAQDVEAGSINSGESITTAYGSYLYLLQLVILQNYPLTQFC